MSQLWRVQGSFYVEAESAAEAEATVAQVVNSALVQRLLGPKIGDIDVHKGDTETWDMSG